MTTIERSFAALLCLLLIPAAARALEGRVVSVGGVPIEQARVDHLESGTHAFTDGRGRFRLAEVEPPAELVVSHPRFHSQVVDLETGDTAELLISLVAKQEIFEEIVVSANRGESVFAPVSVAADVVEPDDQPMAPSSVTEMVTRVPGVSENGQGGLFQVYSIRGVSRQRILTLLEGTRVVSERRAGVSASFVDPQILDRVDVVRGPSSTYYGSDALGGVIQLFPRVYRRLEIAAGYQSQGDENYQALGWGDGAWSLGLARRHAISTENPDGERIPSGFEQTSGTLRRRWESAGLTWDALVLASAGRDIEKASTDFPDRITLYPEENHLLLRLGVTGASGWTASAYVHPNDLGTDVLRPGESRQMVENESTELGATWRQRLFDRGDRSVAVGAEYFGRRGVDAVETDLDLTGQTPPVVRRTLDGAEEDQLGGYGAVEWRLDHLNLTAGLRGTWQRQANASRPSRDDSALSGFAGLVAPLGGGFELTANLGSGLRFPTLSERFFSGTTGRGGVIGNPDLDAERSLSADLGLRWFGERLFVSGYVFRNEIDDYIERIEISEDLLTYVNLTSGRIEGIEVAGSYAVRPGISLSFGGHLLDGEADDGSPLADVPADRAHLGLDGARERWSWAVRLEHRDSKSEVGGGERPIPAADLLSASLGFELTPALTLSLSGDNLLDESYYNSADDKVPLAAGRSLGVGVEWRRE